MRFARNRFGCWSEAVIDIPRKIDAIVQLSRRSRLGLKIIEFRTNESDGSPVCHTTAVYSRTFNIPAFDVCHFWLQIPNSAKTTRWPKVGTQASNPQNMTSGKRTMTILYGDERRWVFSRMQRDLRDDSCISPRQVLTLEAWVPNFGHACYRSADADRL